MHIEWEMEHIGESQAVANHDHDMIHELSKRIDTVWRFDQYIVNAGMDRDLQEVKPEAESMDRRLDP